MARNTTKKRKSTVQSLLHDAVDSLPAATGAFVDLVTAAPGERAKLAERLHEVESAADERYLAIIRKVSESFITPYDREDIYQMVEALDDVVDQLDHAGALLARFKLGTLPDELVANAKSLNEMAEMSHQTVRLIKKPQQLERLLVDINVVENEMDDRYRDLLVEMLDDAKARDVIKIKTLADCIEAAATKLDQFGRSVGLIAIKET